jgi:U6 snRNA-associated Sm-like protein LSm2
MWGNLVGFNLLLCGQLFFSYFKELVGKEVTVELKNDLAIRGTLHSVDQYLNIKLENTRVVDQEKYPHMV